MKPCGSSLWPKMTASDPLAGQVAVVTGGARGIGAAIAHQLAEAGAHVVIADLNPPAAPFAFHRLDVSDEAAVADCVAAIVADFGRIDILVNNAALGGLAPFLEIRPDDWRRMLDVSLTGAFLMAQAAARVMVAAGRGQIVNITSTSGQRGGRGRAAYGAAKAGLELLTKVMAVELAPHGLRVNAVSPGPVETEMVRAAHDAATREAYGRMIPAARYGTPEEIARAVLFLCSGQVDYLNGHVLNVDGGFAAAGVMF